MIRRGCVPGGTKENLKTAHAHLEWNKTPTSRRLLLADAQTSGGLLLCVPPRRLDQVSRLLGKDGVIIGQIVRKAGPLLHIIS